MESDGYTVSAAPHFDAPSLKSVDILVVANAAGAFLDSATAPRKGAMGPAFTPEECDTIRDWVSGGGSLMLIADHVPWGDASAILAQRFGVEMGLGIVMDLKHADGNPTKLVFSVDNGLLGEHAIVRGRNPSERVRKILAFTGQSLTVPANATVLMKIGDDATESFDPEDQGKIQSGIPAGTKVKGRAQGIAMPFGKGRSRCLAKPPCFPHRSPPSMGIHLRRG